MNSATAVTGEYHVEPADYIKPLTQVADRQSVSYTRNHDNEQYQQKQGAVAAAYQTLIAPTAAEQQDIVSPLSPVNNERNTNKSLDNIALQYVAPHYASYHLDNQVHLICLRQWELKINQHKSSC